MSLKRKIFIDLDGVIVDFVVPTMQWWNANIDSEAQYPEGCGWNVLKATNLFRAEQGLPILDAPTFWDGLDYGFWRNLPLYPLAKEFVGIMETHGDVYFATSPTLSSACVAGKFDHIKEDFPHLSRRLIITADKSVLAGPRCTLIDDRDRNCETFVKAGGEAVLVPRPWNDRGFAGTHNPLLIACTEVAALCI